MLQGMGGSGMLAMDADSLLPKAASRQRRGEMREL